MPSFGGIEHGFDHSRSENHNLSHEVDEELIPTAIVIKNIPFAVKKEQLVSVMTDMGLPLPYAFNYHFDQGVFRGLAFANFTTAEETACVINSLNHYDLAGRKLRVEYKKMLPLVERERIEREKRIKRGQLEEQHRPLSTIQLQNQSSMNSLSSQLAANSPSPVSSRPRVPTFNHHHQQQQQQQQQAQAQPMSDLRNLSALGINFNDPDVLQFYSQLILFKNGKEEEYGFSPNLTPQQRRLVHTLAHQLRLAHVSRGHGDVRAVHVYRSIDQVQLSPTGAAPSHAADTQRRSLNRAATTDFSDVRSDGFYTGPTIARQTSGLLTGFPDSVNGFSSHNNLRAAKSYADLRSYTPSPVPSTASFPANLTNNIARFAEYGHGTTGASNPNLAASAVAQRDDMLATGLGNMNLNSSFGAGGSPRSARIAWERDVPAPIGSNRAFSTTVSLEEMTQNRGLPLRQPRGPIAERNHGFSQRVNPRQNGHNSTRGSDELSSQAGVELLTDQQITNI